MVFQSKWQAAKEGRAPEQGKERAKRLDAKHRLAKLPFWLDGTKQAYISSTAEEGKSKTHPCMHLHLHLHLLGNVYAQQADVCIASSTLHILTVVDG